MSLRLATMQWLDSTLLVPPCNSCTVKLFGVLLSTYSPLQVPSSTGKSRYWSACTSAAKPGSNCTVVPAVPNLGSVEVLKPGFGALQAV
jgi:hypothetical protein